MSERTRLDVAPKGAPATYTLTERAGCTLVRGEVPISSLAKLMKASGRHAILDPDLARLADATMAWGAPSAVEALRRELRAEKLAAARAGKPMDGLSAAAQEWLLAGEHGLSACAIFWRLTGTKPPILRGDRGFAHPHDPDDLRRCMLLLEQVPELSGRIGEMRGASRHWDALIPGWETLCGSMAAEIPNWREPPRGSAAKRTYLAMKAVLDPVDRLVA